MIKEDTVEIILSVRKDKLFDFLDCQYAIYLGDLKDLEKNALSRLIDSVYYYEKIEFEKAKNHVEIVTGRIDKLKNQSESYVKILDNFFLIAILPYHLELHRMIIQSGQGDLEILRSYFDAALLSRVTNQLGNNNESKELDENYYLVNIIELIHAFRKINSDEGKNKSDLISALVLYYDTLIKKVLPGVSETSLSYFVGLLLSYFDIKNSKGLSYFKADYPDGSWNEYGQIKDRVKYSRKRKVHKKIIELVKRIDLVPIK